jgi:hypothetical protein
MTKIRSAGVGIFLVVVTFAQLRIGTAQAVSEAFTITVPRHVGSAIRGAPYSGELIVEEGSQKKYVALVFRNSEGTTRVDELAGNSAIAEITDPVAEISEILDLQNHVAHRVRLEGLTTIGAGCCPEKTISWQSTERFLLNSAGKSMPAALNTPGVRGDGGDVGGPGMIDGLPAEAYSQILTVPPGGLQLNFQPIIFRIESWYSENLKVTLLYKISDSRDGGTTIRVTNIKPGEPDAALFQVPADYSTIEEKGAFTINLAR